MGIISLSGMEFFAYHGVYAEEREKGNTFIVDIAIDTDTHEAERTDQLEDTVDYVAVYELVKSQMSIPSNLLEHVARRILDQLRTHIRQGNVTLTIYKQHPPLEGRCTHSAITLTETIV